MNKLQAILAMLDGASVENAQNPNHVFFIDTKGKLPVIMVFEKETKPQSINIDSLGSVDSWNVSNVGFRRNVEAAAGSAAPQKYEPKDWISDETVDAISGRSLDSVELVRTAKIVRMVVDKLKLQAPPPDAPVPNEEGPIGEVYSCVRPEEEQAYYRRCRALELALEYNRLPNVGQSPDAMIGTAKKFEEYLKG